MKFETVMGAIIAAELVGAFQTDNGKWSLLASDGRRFRTNDPEWIAPDELIDLGWRDGNAILVTMTSNTAGRITGMTVNG